MTADGCEHCPVGDDFGAIRLLCLDPSTNPNAPLTGTIIARNFNTKRCSYEAIFYV